MFGATIFLVLAAALIVPDRIGWIRNVLNFVVFQAFLLYVHYMKEVAERRLYTLRDELKTQFKATQKAQINERRAAESKRRLTSYVFHEVRVPLNTALIAVQNMEATGAYGGKTGNTGPAREQDVEFRALEGSLSMMSKVLNDVLDFNRMDSGRFESVSRPYPFHSVMRSMFVPLQLATDARGLHFDAQLDPAIDIVARRAAWESLGAQHGRGPHETFEKYLEEVPHADGIVVGDEMRLRQIITNLASNACKFTPSGGMLSIKTKLIVPTSASVSGSNAPGTDVPPSASERLHLRQRSMTIDVLPTHNKREKWDEKVGSSSSSARSEGGGQYQDLESGGIPALSARTLDQHNASHQKRAAILDTIVVRIEVTDTGYGIKAKDMVRGKLFCEIFAFELL